MPEGGETWSITKSKITKEIVPQKPEMMELAWLDVNTNLYYVQLFKGRYKCPEERNERYEKDKILKIKNTISKMKSSLFSIKIRWGNAERKLVNLRTLVETMQNEALKKINLENQKKNFSHL